MWIMALIGTDFLDHGFLTFLHEFFSEILMWIMDFSSLFSFSAFNFDLFSSGVLAAAIPVAFLNPSLGFRKRRSAEEEEEKIFELLPFAQKAVEEGEEVFNS